MAIENSDESFSFQRKKNTIRRNERSGSTQMRNEYSVIAFPTTS